MVIRYITNAKDTAESNHKNQMSKMFCVAPILLQHIKNKPLVRAKMQSKLKSQILVANGLFMTFSSSIVVGLKECSVIQLAIGLHGNMAMSAAL